MTVANAIFEQVKGKDTAMMDTEDRNDLGAQLRACSKDCLIWYDFWSISQPTSRFAQENPAKAVEDLSRAVDSIPYYVGNSAHFLVLSPPIRHSNNNSLCDALAFKERGWCRLELLAWHVYGGGEPTTFINGPEQLTQMPSTSVIHCPPVGLGSFTCCDRFKDHIIGYDEEAGEPTKIPCDKTRIVDVLSTFVNRSIKAYKSIGDLQMYRISKSLWRLQFLGFDKNSIKRDEDLHKQPETWSEFCEHFLLDERFKHLSHKQQKKLNCLPPLFYAVWSLNVPVVKEILESKVNPNFVVKGPPMLIGINFNGFTAMNCAGMSCREENAEEAGEIMRLLVEHRADPYIKTPFVFGPIAQAIWFQNNFFWKWLKAHYSGFSFDRGINTFPRAGLAEQACVNCDFEVVRACIDGKANFNHRNELGISPTHSLNTSPGDFNFMNSPGEVMKMLVDNNMIDNVEQEIDIRKSSRKIAMTYILRIFLWHCRREYRRKFKKIGDKIETLNQMSVLKGYFAILDGCTMLHMVCWHGGSVELVDYLVERKADLERENAIGITPLDMAVWKKNRTHEDILRRALKKS